MGSRETHAKRVGKFYAALLSNLKESGMRQRNHFLHRFAVVRCNKKLYVYRIGVTDRNARLQPPELHLPGSSERVRSRVE
jgi:hypothetical protein